MCQVITRKILMEDWSQKQAMAETQGYGRELAKSNMIYVSDRETTSILGDELIWIVVTSTLLILID